MSDLHSRVAEALGSRYRVERKLGEGGMAVVFLAEDLKHRRRVALKVLKPEIAAATARQRFLREIEIAANLSHPNILPLYDSGHHDDLLYYVMPYVEGDSLADRLERERQLPIQDAIRIACEVAEALDYAHAHDVLHRDIKPSNILLSEGHALVVDFGIARALSESTGETLTQTGIAIGSPAYMSPEQAAGDSHIDGRSDLYALGCVLYQMVAGEPPFSGATPQSVIAMHVAHPAPSMRAARHGVPDEVELAVDTALQKLPADRFSSGGQFAQVLQGRDTATRVVTRARRRRAVLGAIRLSLPLLTVAAILLIWSPWDRGVGEGPSPTVGMQTELDRFRRLAVLFFDAREGSDEGTRVFADELTRALIADFASISAIQTTSERAVRMFRESDAPLDSIAGRLDVGMLIYGYVTQVSDSVRIRAELIDGARGTALGVWEVPLENGEAEEVELVAAAVEALSPDLRAGVYELLQVFEAQLETQSQDAIMRVETANRRAAEASQLFLSGRFQDVEAELSVADSLLIDARRFDNSWVEPLIRRAELTRTRAILESVLGGGRSPGARQALEEGLRMLDLALDINSFHPRVHAMRCRIKDALRVTAPPQDRAEYETLLMDIEGACMDAVTRQPDLAGAWSTLASLHFVEGDYRRARRDAERAFREDVFGLLGPESMSTLAMAALELGDDQEALTRCREGMQRYGAPYLFLDCELTVRAHGDSIVPDVDEAWDLYGRFLTEIPPRAAPSTPQLAKVASILARAGFRDSANGIIDQLRQAELGDTIDPAVPPLLLETAAALVRTGRIDEALDDLQRYLEAEPVTGHQELARRQFTPLRGHPEFEALMGA